MALEDKGTGIIEKLPKVEAFARAKEIAFNVLSDPELQSFILIPIKPKEDGVELQVLACAPTEHIITAYEALGKTALKAAIQCLVSDESPPNADTDNQSKH